MAVAPSLIEQVCSEITVSPWSLTKVRFDETSSLGTNREPEAPAFRLMAKKSTYDDGEWFALHVASDPSSDWNPQTDGTCPTVFLEVDSPGHAARIDEVQPRSFIGCGENSARQKTGEWQTGFDLDSGIHSRWGGPGEHTFQVFAIGPPDGTGIHFVASNVLHIQILDPMEIPRTWGPLIQGLRASIALDKNTYEVGEDIPLHIAIQNLSADPPVYSESPVWDPFFTVGIQVLDNRGQPLASEARLPATGIITGHGRGLMPFEKGKPAFLEWALGGLGWLPKNPGSYTIVASWTPCVTDHAERSGPFISVDPQSCVRVRATTSIRVVPRGEGGN